MSDRLTLSAASVPEWEAEVSLFGGVGDDFEQATPAEAASAFDEVVFRLPRQTVCHELTRFAASHATPLGAEAVDEHRRGFAFYLHEVPLGILIPDHQKLTRIKLNLEANTGSAAGDLATTGQSVVAYDLFPTDEWRDAVHDIGEATIDVAKALPFVLPGVGEALGLKLRVPFRWRSRDIRVRTTDRMSNPLEWYVQDEDIDEGFTGYAIWRAPKHAPVTVKAELWGELHLTGLLKRRKVAVFRASPRVYSIS